ncbi:TetR/AcrR family transcriptional regulator C-terminal domain-containing protein [Streptomonospora nanhaiensis]|uniref:AcrR family transcriptional regulator n=1 Tax=Streptomonospora nanhaiensis TaxID=1323731 RepID=A0A853BVA8_9ACTN|nr:TetR/AcrR family transcriptional regulator C-terminal domain-containing protein [Streptomonospora nanhaiensis]MBV2366541.1 TetR/AcrR family transcriptional regulator C-terminal domain-containing protein [Streptomonospora nanhaiensis]MBX9388388.1 TetR/AcrR family transcriptional regulator C-terminal domain-containing protein [Streptomonospora nanhaiensis]NYI98447.1 AcrR family transcriptional regulator [Streptomonospora nanhaiensis]
MGAGAGEPGGVWLRAGGDRPRRERLTRERIVEAAVGLLDAEGVPGFSMRRLAARLRAGTMSLYEYVSGKEDVLDLALDAVLGELPPAAPDTPWRAAVTAQAAQSRRVMLRHPWVPALVGTRPLLGPNALAASERFHAALAATGLDDRRVAAAVSAVTGYVDGYVLKEALWRARHRDPAAEADLRGRVWAHIGERADAYPALGLYARLAAEGATDFDTQFRIGLDIVLDGIAAQIGGAGSAAVRTGPRGG